MGGCNDTPCAAVVNCQWGQWSDFGACSRECGGGTKTRFRHVDVMPKHGGKGCSARDSLEVNSCNNEPCGELEYCAWGEWSYWSTCANTQGCGRGARQRKRALGFTETKPSDENDVLVTGLLAGEGALSSLNDIAVSQEKTEIKAEKISAQAAPSSTRSSGGMFGGLFSLHSLASTETEHAAVDSAKGHSELFMAFLGGMVCSLSLAAYFVLRRSGNSGASSRTADHQSLLSSNEFVE